MARPLTVGQLVWRPMRQAWDAPVRVYTDDEGCDVYDVELHDDGMVSIGCEEPGQVTLEGEKQPPRAQYRAQSAGATFKVNFVGQAERPAVGQNIEVQLGHGRSVRGTVLGFDEYGNCTIQADQVKQQPRTVNYDPESFKTVYGGGRGGKKTNDQIAEELHRMYPHMYSKPRR